MSDVDAPLPEEFAAQLIGQVLGDLDGILFADEAPIADARSAVYAAAAQGQPRGATLLVLARAALSAHATLLSEVDTAFAEPGDDAVSMVIDTIVPGTARHLATLRQIEQRMHHQLSPDQPDRPLPWNRLAQAIHRLYGGMRENDEAMARNGLFELRSMTVHLDAIACALASEPTLPARRALRPDRFHDLYVGYLEAVRAGDGAQQPVATLQHNGRIAAMVSASAHPVQQAEQNLRNSMKDDVTGADAALARIRALVILLDELRRSPRPTLGSVEDESLQLSLIIAAATAPLRSNQRYAFGEIAQVACYNRSLLAASPAQPATTRH